MVGFSKFSRFCWAPGFVPSVRYYWRSQGGHNFEKSETDGFEATKDTWRAEIRTQFCQLWSLCWLRFLLFVQGLAWEQFQTQANGSYHTLMPAELEAPWRKQVTYVQDGTFHVSLLSDLLNDLAEYFLRMISGFLVLHLPNPCLLGTLSCSVF